MLSGRFVSFRVRPFVYREMLEYAKELNKEQTIIDYLIYGGMPKRLELPSTEEVQRYLQDIQDSIIYNDIIVWFNIKKPKLFKSFSSYILQSNSRIFSSKSIAKYVSSNYEQCSTNTILKYLDHLEQAYIINELDLYSTKSKKILSYYKKLYNEDAGFISIAKTDDVFDLTHNLENIVYLELVYQGFELQVYNFDGKEIDFKASKNNKAYFIQVCYSLVEKKTYDREFSAFAKMDNLNKKIIITNDELDYSTSTVKHIKLKDFLIKDLEELA